MPPSPFGYPPLNATENLQNQVNHAGSILDNPYPSPREGNMPNETFDALYGRDPMNDEWWMMMMMWMWNGCKGVYQIYGDLRKEM